jgi:translation initiation factor IF-3
LHPVFKNLKLKRIAIFNKPSFNKPFRRGPQRPEEPYRINERITAPKVRVVGEDIKVDVYPVQQAIKMAQDQGLDLVEISPNADPPVCKIVDYSKFKYEQKKKQKEIKAKALKVVLKEIRFGPNTDEHDFAGRSIVYKERGEILLLKFAQGLEEFGKVEQLPKLEGKRMSMIVMAKALKK